VQSSLQIGAILHDSVANGPGHRLVIWTQGCSSRCPQCFNPAFAPGDGGAALSLREFQEIVRNLHPRIEGITYSGGEPLDQSDQLAEFTSWVNSTTHLSQIVYTGYAASKVLSDAHMRAVSFNIDVLIDGSFAATMLSPRGCVGSENQNHVFLTNRYTSVDFHHKNSFEVQIDDCGVVVSTGFPPGQD